MMLPRWRSRWRSFLPVAGCSAGYRRTSKISYECRNGPHACASRGAAPRGGAIRALGRPGGANASMSALLSLTAVGKDYAKIETRGGRVRLVWDLIRGNAAAHVFRALDDVTFDLQRGESLGVVGEN